MIYRRTRVNLITIVVALHDEKQHSFPEPSTMIITVIILKAIIAILIFEEENWAKSQNGNTAVAPAAANLPQKRCCIFFFIQFVDERKGAEKEGILFFELLGKSV